MADTELAHIVHPGKKLRDVVAGRGQRTKALCGVYVMRRSEPDAPVCRGCFDGLRRLDQDARGQAEEGSRRG